MPTYKFEEVSITGIKRWVDANGKKRQKTRRFWQTLNPFNKSAAGVPKSREEIVAELIVERQSWMEEAEVPHG